MNLGAANRRTASHSALSRRLSTMSTRGTALAVRRTAVLPSASAIVRLAPTGSSGQTNGKSSSTTNTGPPSASTLSSNADELFWPSVDHSVWPWADQSATRVAEGNAACSACFQRPSASSESENKVSVGTPPLATMRMDVGTP
eukprot:536221-Prymnesium_polylepis.1